MSNKSLLVAQREYMENLRTKTFWIGILFFPVIVVMAIVVPMLLERAKDARKYAVIDHSGWLLERVEDRATMPDMEKVLISVATRYLEEDESFADLPEELQACGIQLGSTAMALAEQQGEGDPSLDPRKAGLAWMDENEFKEVTSRLATFFTTLEAPTSSFLMESSLLDDFTDEAMRIREQIRTWWKSLPAEEAKEFGSRMSKSRYVRIEVEGTGEEAVEKLNQRVVDGDLFAYFEIGPEPVAGNEGFKYVSNNLTDDDLRNWFQRFATDEVRERRLDQEEIDKETSRWIQSPVRFDKKKLGETGEEEEVEAQDTIRQWAPVGFVYFLWLAIFTIAQMLLTNTIEEKSNRILEVLLSSVSPLQLMTGKIIGIAWTGLTVVSSWVLSFALLVNFVPGLLGKKLDFNLAEIAADPLLLSSFLVYFLLGYLFFAALLVGIGSVCNSVKEANNLMMPVTVVLMLPLFAMIPISQDPNGKLAVFLSYIPPFTPFVMMNRAGGPPATYEYVITTVILLVSIAVVFWAAAKVFRIGILMTGKPPTPMEILRWVRAPVGQVPVREEEE